MFKYSVKDTIIKLPTHVGDGPFTRNVSMKPISNFDLPAHHATSRSLDGNRNVIFEVKIDYNFHLIQRADAKPILLRVDYANLLPIGNHSHR